MMRHAAVLLILVFALPHRGLAQTGASSPPSTVQPLSLDDAIRIALAKHPAIKEAEAAVLAAEARVKEARASYYPQLSFSGIGKVGLSGATGALGLPGFPASPFFRNTAYSGNLYQTIFDFGRIKHFVASQRALSESTRVQEIEEEQRIVLGVRRGYFSVLEALQLERVAKQIVEDRSLTRDRARAYYQAGLGSQLELSLAQANLAEAQGGLIQAQNTINTAFAALRAAMGVDGSQSYELQNPKTETVSLPPLDDLVQSGLKDRPDEQALQFKITALSENLGLARAQSLPSINGFAAGGQGRFNGTTVKEEQRHGVGALGLLVPIFTGGRLKAEREEARAELQGATAGNEELQQQIRLQVSQAYYQLQDLSGRIRAADEQRKAAQQALTLAQARYQVQLSSFLEVVAAQLAAARAETSLARTQFDYERAKADLDFATGRRVRP